MINGDLCAFTVAAKLGDETPVTFIPPVGDDDCELAFVTEKDPLISP